MELSFTADKYEISIGESVTFYVNYDGAVQVKYNEEENVWTNIGDVSSSTPLIWTPTKGGTFTVTATFSGATDPAATLTITVNPLNVTLDSSNYYTCDGTCTVLCTVKNNNELLSNETVTLTGTGSTLTSTTDANGVATFNLSNISASTTLTATWSNITDTSTLTFYDPNTLNGSLMCLGRKMARNLNLMGIENVSAADGLTTLADAILDIEGAIGGIDVVTAISCNVSNTEVIQNESFVISGVLEADKDDTSQTDVDLEGYLKSATVKIFDGNTLIGSAITDGDGRYSLTYTPTVSGVMSIVALFEGTVDYDSCQSSSITVNVIESLTLSSDKDILSYADGDVAVLTAVYSGGEGATVVFKAYKDDTLVETIGSAVTDINGEANVSYYSKGTGDLYIHAECMNLTKTYSIRDVYLGGDTDTIKQYWTANTSVSGRTIYSHSPDFTEDISIEFKFKNQLPTSWVVGLGYTDSPYTTKGMFTYLNHEGRHYLDIYYSERNRSNISVELGSQHQSFTTDTVFKIETRDLHTIYWYINDTVVAYRSTKTDIPLRLRVDDFGDLDLDYIIIEKL